MTGINILPHVGVSLEVLILLSFAIKSHNFTIPILHEKFVILKVSTSPQW